MTHLSLRSFPKFPMASTSNIQNSPLSLSSSCSEYQWEVFLSFGGDTRYTFTDHLYHALYFDRGINTFRDSEGLERGKPISLELLNAIEKSRIAVVILSAKYASSTWCLDELAKIVECMDAEKMTVLPIFYHVDPSDVRHLKGTIADAFAKHDLSIFKENIKKKVQRWRDALTRVAGLSGHHLKDHEPESEFIYSFVEKISSGLNDTIESVYKDKYVGIDSPVQEILDLHIDMASKDDVRFIGICGMSGIGKTTLAQVVFEMIHRQFQASSFLRDVKRRDDLSDSQDQLLRDMKLKTEIPKWDELKATNTTSHRLRNKKVIIVVDDADEEKLEKLAGNRDWFGLGSRIIITTGDKGLLEKRCGKKYVYMAKKLNASDALQLFSRKAFDEPHCEKDLLDICNGFVSYVDGHPLALKTLGSSMHGITNIGLWKAELERLGESAELPNDDRIQTALRISYNGLRTPQKKLFLDIACFFNGEDKDRVADLLEDSGCIPKNDIKALIDKSLITILGRKVWMHHLLQQMGWEIVRQESLQEPGGRSRLWRWKDVHHVLKKNTGTIAVEGIMLNMPPQKEERPNAEAFSKMEKLKLLQIRNVQLPQGLSYLSKKLRLLEWHEYPLKSMPMSFQPNKLVELIMPRCHIKELPKGFSNLGRLKLMDLSDSQNLTRTPNFTGLPNLERVIFQGCTKLYEVHPSIGVHKRLTLLNLKDCKYLNSLPPEMNLESLEILIVSGCSMLKKFPEIGQNMTRLSRLYLDGTAIEKLPLSLEHLTGLTLLNLRGCNNFLSFPSVICRLTSLKTLTLSRGTVDGKPHNFFRFSNLLVLFSSVCLLGFHINTFFSESHSYPLSLFQFVMSVLFIILWTFILLIVQYDLARKADLLLPKYLSGLGSLVSLDLSDCNLEDGALPDDLSFLSSLQSLNLSKNHFTCLPGSVSQLSKLKFLYLDNCSRLKSLPNLPLSIQSVMAQECTSLVQNLTQETLGSSVDLRPRQELIEYLMNPSPSHVDEPEPSGQSDSSPRQKGQVDEPRPKRQLKELLSKLYEGDSARYHCYDYIFPQIQIAAPPRWFTYQNFGSDIKMELPSNLNDNTRWLGFTVYALFTVHKQPACSGDNEDSIVFVTFSGVAAGDSVAPGMGFPHSRDTFVGSHRLLMFYMPRALFELNGCSNIWASFQSDNPSVEITMCGIRAVYEEDVEEFVQTLVECLLGCPDAYHNSIYGNLLDQVAMMQGCNHGEDFFCSFSTPQPTPKLLPSTIENAAGTSRNSSPSQIQLGIAFRNGQSGTPETIRMLHTWFKRFVQDHYNHRGIYNHYFPEREIPQWFRHPSEGNSVTIDIPQNLFNDSNWMGKHVWNQMSWAKFSFLSYNPDMSSALKCGVNLICRNNLDEFTRTIVQLMTSYVDYLHLMIRNSCKKKEPTVYKRLPIYHGEEEVRSSYEEDPRPQRVPVQAIPPEHTSLRGLGIPQPFYETGPLDFNPLLLYNNCFPPNKVTQEWFSHQSRGHLVTIDIPPNLYNDNNWMGLHILYQNDEDFFKEIIFKTHLYNKYENEANKFDGCLVYNSCFPPNEILDWFSHRSDEPQLTISLPPNLYDDPTWMGLALCVSFSLHEDGTTINVNDRDSPVPCNLICHLETAIGSLEPPHMYCLTEEYLVLLRLGGFIWLSYIPRGSFPNWLNQSSLIEASIATNLPGWTVQKCGFRLLYQNEEIEFKETIRHCMASLSAACNVIHQSTIANENTVKPNHEDKAAELITTIISDEYCHLERLGGSLDPRPKDKGKNDPHSKNQDFDRCLVYNSCFPPYEILDWFKHRSDEPQVKISLPPNLYGDRTWMGLALCVSFSVQEHGTTIDNRESQVPCNFICHLETAIGGLEPLHIYCLTKEDLMLLRLGGFIWLSYIPRGSFPNWLIQSSFIEASVAIDCLGLSVHKCGFRLLYETEEMEFKETIRRCTDSWDVIDQLTIANEKTVKPNHDDKGVEPSTTNSSDDPMPKDKGKRIVE